MRNVFIFLIPLLMSCSAIGQKKDFAVIAYYAGDGRDLDSFKMRQLTHIIYSFCHLKGARLHVDNAGDSAVIQKLVGYKKQHPPLKVLLSLGGWGGCEHCSAVFSDSNQTKIFAASVLELCRYFGTDGIDLDWEYPAIQGFPGHPYKPEDKNNFTRLVKTLRQTMGDKYEISFAAGGFTDFIEKSIDWAAVMIYVDRVNIMNYDLVHNFSTTTGHHTPLYSTGSQKESTDNAIRKLQALSIPSHQLVIGAAFYGRVWEDVPDTNNGLYQPGKFLKSLSYRQFHSEFAQDSGYVAQWDESAQAPYLYHPQKKWFVTFDDQQSIRLKTEYALRLGLGGIMFWQLGSDRYKEGLLNVIHQAVISHQERKQ